MLDAAQGRVIFSLHQPTESNFLAALLCSHAIASSLALGASHSFGSSCCELEGRLHQSHVLACRIRFVFVASMMVFGPRE